MLKEALIQKYESDLGLVVEELEKYGNEEDIWIVDKGISNSAGNLALHLIGNINHFFGANLGGTGYVRERDLEFSEKGITRDELVNGIRDTAKVLSETFSNLSDEDLHSDYPEEIFGGTHKTIAICIYMLTHLNYHLGQINYHRRLLSK